MTMTYRQPLGILIVFLMWFAGVHQARADGHHLQFSAEAVQIVPDRPANTMRMFIGEHAVRTEYMMGEQLVAEIIEPEKKRRILLIPYQRTYMEQVTEKMPRLQFGKRPNLANPCADMEGVTCQRLGEEVVNGRPAVKWVFVSQFQGQTMKSTHWIDKARGLAIREQFPDGTRTELKLIAEEMLGKRKTEKWELQVVGKDGRKTTSLQWYDPELQVTIREELPGGYVRELRNIKVGPQPPGLFEVPPGYQKVATPRQTYGNLQQKP